MKRLALLLMMLVSPLGCKRLDTTPGPEEKPKGLPRDSDFSGSRVALRQCAGGGAANDHDLNQLYQIVYAAYLRDDRVHGSTQIMEEIKQSNNLVKLIKDEVLILSNTSNPEGILVYALMAAARRQSLRD